MKHFTPKRLSIALLACAITTPAFADTATDINSANALLREGKIDEALDTYRSVTPSDAIKADLDYNLAVAQYRKGDIESAKAMFTEAATSSNSKLAAAARYNLGNCFYADAVAAAEKDKPAAIESLGQAIEHYRGSLTGNPNHVDARANIELAAELMKKLQQEQEQDQQDQQQQQRDQQQNEQNQDQQNQDQQSQDQQSQDSESKEGESQQDQQQQDQGQENQQKQDQGSESKDNQSQAQEGEQDQSKSGDQQSGSEAQPSEQQQSQDKSGQSQDSEDQAGKEGQPKPDQSAQENASQKPSQERQQTANDDETLASSATEQAEAKDQPVPSGELKAAAEQDESEGSRSLRTLDTIQDGLMSKEEALKMLQAVRDRDMLRRLRQEQLERNMHVPTDKDW